MGQRTGNIIIGVFGIAIFLAVILLILNTIANTGPPKYEIKINHFPIHLYNLTTLGSGNSNYMSENPTTEIEYFNGPGLNLTINIDNRPVVVDTSYVFITKTLYNGSTILQKFNGRLNSANQALNIISDNETVIETNLQNNTTELYLATNNKTIWYPDFNSSLKSGNALIPPESNYTNNQSYSSSTPVHLIFLISQFGGNLTTVSFYIYGNYNSTSSSTIAERFLAIGVNNVTITKFTGIFS